MSLRNFLRQGDLYAETSVSPSRNIVTSGSDSESERGDLAKHRAYMSSKLAAAFAALRGV